MVLTGGCQCGRIRYRAEQPRDRASVCYCRMCQKASGGPFMAFVRFPASQVHWSRPPEIFASSSHAERGFCSACGTPLTYRQVNGPNISLTLGSLDNPGAVPPDMRFSPALEPPWCRTLQDLPGREMDFAGSPGFVSNQKSE